MFWTFECWMTPRPKPVHIFLRSKWRMFKLQERPPALQNMKVKIQFSCLEEHFDLSVFRSGSFDSIESWLATLQGGQRAEPGQAASCQEDRHAPQCHVPAQEGAWSDYCWYLCSVLRILDPVLFLAPGSGMGKNSRFGSGIRIRDEHLGSFHFIVWELGNNFLG